MTRIRTSGEQWTHTRAHTFGVDTSALQKREDHANSIFAPWWNDHTEERERERERERRELACVPIWPRCLNCHICYSIIGSLDGPVRKWSPLLRLYVCTRVHILYTVQSISGKSHNISPRRMRREAEWRDGKERKLSLNSQTLRSQQFLYRAYNARYSYDSCDRCWYE